MIALSRHRQHGAGLVEALIAMTITTIVILGLAGLVLSGVRLQQVARLTTTATAFAIAQVERLRVLPSTAPERQIGGSLTADVADHFSSPEEGVTLRWVVANGPAGTRDLTLRLLINNVNVRTTDLHVLMSP
jgi:hypothetical protein